MRSIPKLFSIFFVLFSSKLLAQDVHTVSDQKHCITKSTKSSGERRSCYIYQELKAPSGFMFRKTSANNLQLGHAGTGHGCVQPQFHYSETASGFHVITSITASGNARSRSGANSVLIGVINIPAGATAEIFNRLKTKGAVECKLTAEYVKIPN